MYEYLTQLLEQLGDSPVRQAMVAAFCTLFFEDPTVITCGLLIADGRMHFWAAVIGLAIGIHVGDLWLYFLGRMLGPRILEWNWISKERYDQWSRFLNKNLVAAVIMSRFLPGTRIPAFAGAGILGAPFHRFLLIGITASFLWTMFLLTVTIKIGERILPLLGDHKWTVFLVLLGLFLVVPRLIRAVRRQSPDAAPDTGTTMDPAVRSLGFWHGVLIYLPAVLYYLWLAIRFRSLTLPGLSHLVGHPGVGARHVPPAGAEPVLMMRLAEAAPGVVPRHLVYTSRGEGRAAEFARVIRELSAADIGFPLVARPMAGFLRDRTVWVMGPAALRRLVGLVPAGESLLLQAPSHYPLAAEVVYYRLPTEESGRILSITFKTFPSIVGDGVSTIGQLIDANPEARLVREDLRRRHRRRLGRVLRRGVEFPLTGGITAEDGILFRDGTAMGTPALTERLGALCELLPGVYFARFELRYQSLERLLEGHDFHVVALGGPSAGDGRLRDSRTTLAECYKILFELFEILFLIGEQNRQRGYRTTGPKELLTRWITHWRVSRRFPT